MITVVHTCVPPPSTDYYLYFVDIPDKFRSIGRSNSIGLYLYEALPQCKTIHRSTIGDLRMTPRTTTSCKLSCLLALLLVTLCALPARATTYNTGVNGGGTLSWTNTLTATYGCPGGETYAYTQTNFVYTTSTGLPTVGSDGSTYLYSTGIVNECPPTGPGQPVSDGNFTDSNGVEYEIGFTPSNDGTSGTATVTVLTTQGFINPKYVVVGVVYAPPGTSSNVTYTNTTSVGNTTTIAKSFQSNTGFSVSTTTGTTAVPAAGVVNGAVKVTATESTNYTYGSSSSKTNTLTQTDSVSYKVGGTPTLSPLTNDYDYILLWLNPELLVSYTPQFGSNPASLVWTGYAFDPNDPYSGQPPPSGPYIAAPDVYPVQVGCLNGHFPANTCQSTLTWENGVEGPGSFVTGESTLARGWQSASKGYAWPSGEQSGLSFNDVCQILSFDPLSVTPSGCPTPNDYTLLSELPAGTTSDGRYTREPAPYYEIPYPIGGWDTSENFVQSNTLSVSQGNSNQITQAFSVSEGFGGSFLDIFSATTTLTESETLTWNYSTLNALTTAETLTNALSVTGPPDGSNYDGPTQFLAYQDNTFGTFVFVPDSY